MRIGSPAEPPSFHPFHSRIHPFHQIIKSTIQIHFRLIPEPPIEVTYPLRLAPAPPALGRSERPEMCPSVPLQTEKSGLQSQLQRSPPSCMEVVLRSGRRQQGARSARSGSAATDRARKVAQSAPKPGTRCAPAVLGGARRGRNAWQHTPKPGSGKRTDVQRCLVAGLGAIRRESPVPVRSDGRSIVQGFLAGGVGNGASDGVSPSQHPRWSSER